MKRADAFAAAVLSLGALAFAVFGVKWLVDPVAMAQPLGIVLTNGDATSDARAVYGGMELGLGVFLAFCGIASSRRALGLTAATMVLGGLGLSRLTGILAAGGVTGGTHALLATDLCGTTLCAVALIVFRRSARSPTG
jgi:hypothetical protein